MTEPMGLLPTSSPRGPGRRPGGHAGHRARWSALRAAAASTRCRPASEPTRPPRGDAAAGGPGSRPVGAG